MMENILKDDENKIIFLKKNVIDISLFDINKTIHVDGMNVYSFQKPFCPQFKVCKFVFDEI